MPKTLPREIIRWIHSLDLSIPYKDSKRDLNNGFLIADIFSRYYPYELSMHGFDNSHNTIRKKNNWYLLAKFFKQKNLRFDPSEYDEIKDGNFNQLVEFMIKVYERLTKRK